MSKDEWDVFLVHSDVDRDSAECIFTVLDRNGLSCITTAFGYEGHMLLEGSLNKIHNSITTLVLLTLRSCNEPWMKLETILALEKAVREKASIRLLVEGNWENDLQKLGLLGKVPRLSLDFNLSNWESELIRNVQAENLILENLLPAGNLALGQVYSLIVGFYRTVLPKLRGVLESHHSGNQKLATTSTRFFILVPSDCRVINICSDGKISLVESIVVGTVVHAGKKRDQRVNIYSIIEGETVYYFVAEIPYVLNTIFMVHASKIVDVDLPFELDRFVLTLQNVLTHRVHENCKDTFHVIRYKEGTLADIILNQIKKDISGAAGNNTGSAMTPHAALAQPDFEFEAAIVFNEHSRKDQEVAEEIGNALRMRNISIEPGWSGEPQFKFLERARWKIFILSKEAFDDMLLKPKCIMALTDSVQKDKIGVIPVLNGITVDEIPEFISWISCVSTTEEYIRCLLNIITGQELKMDHCLPRGNISTGLMWGYIYNYLPIPLLSKYSSSDRSLDFTTRIQNRLKASNVHCGCIQRLYIHVPKTCKEFKLENVEGIECVGELEPVKLEGRPYTLNMYKITSQHLPRGQVCFLAEQATPTTHLFGISNVYRDVGISPKEHHKQVKDFCESCNSTIQDVAFIKNVGDLNSICQFLLYDDEEHSTTKTSLVDVLTMAIKEDIEKNVTVVFS
ncbi:hypothetical protein ACJMK2_019043 [Sinanodonta woodiana]|uniref:STING ligand-binding domain-containing protein n=1 Tax=Sinanodonta woodiana TaxID=1069815 RepID=A0ABD3UF68_SINWO